MKLTSPLVLAAFTTLASAHFTLDYPQARGTFDEDTEGQYCGGQNTIGTRDEFPLTDGFLSIDSHHIQWTAGVFLSTASNPTSFDNFTQIVPYFQLSGEGTFCIPLNLSATNATGLTNNENVTIQVQFDGGDGSLFQCADLTLSNNFTITETCTNATSSSSSNDSDALVPLQLTSSAMLGFFFVTMGLLTQSQ